ncbi:MAG TPA: hypothetical protein VMW66_04255, partial [Elusimicrobiales bacterium]|nr:hypothetical protein [Elusimicrobiales bacterium]
MNKTNNDENIANNLAEKSKTKGTLKDMLKVIFYNGFLHIFKKSAKIKFAKAKTIAAFFVIAILLSPALYAKTDKKFTKAQIEAINDIPETHEIGRMEKERWDKIVKAIEDDNWEELSKTLGKPGEKGFINLFAKRVCYENANCRYNKIGIFRELISQLGSKDNTNLETSKIFGGVWDYLKILEQEKRQSVIFPAMGFATESEKLYDQLMTRYEGQGWVKKGENPKFGGTTLLHYATKNWNTNITSVIFKKIKDVKGELLKKIDGKDILYFAIEKHLDKEFYNSANEYLSILLPLYKEIISEGKGMDIIPRLKSSLKKLKEVDTKKIEKLEITAYNEAVKTVTEAITELNGTPGKLAPLEKLVLEPEIKITEKVEEIEIEPQPVYKYADFIEVGKSDVYYLYMSLVKNIGDSPSLKQKKNKNEFETAVSNWTEKDRLVKLAELMENYRINPFSRIKIDGKNYGDKDIPQNSLFKSAVVGNELELAKQFFNDYSAGMKKDDLIKSLEYTLRHFEYSYEKPKHFSTLSDEEKKKHRKYVDESIKRKEINYKESYGFVLEKYAKLKGLDEKGKENLHSQFRKYEDADKKVHQTKLPRYKSPETLKQRVIDRAYAEQANKKNASLIIPKKINGNKCVKTDSN